MAIVPLKKVTLMGFVEEQDRWLEPLQQLGVMHINVRRQASHSHDPNIGMPDKAQQALRHIMESQYKIKPWQLENEQDIGFIVEEILENKKKLRELSDLRDDYHQFIKVREDWGDFHYPPVEELGGYYFWFYIIPKSQLEKLHDCSYPWKVVDQRQGRCYVIVLCEHEPTKMEVPFKRVRSGYKSLSRLYRELDQVERDLDELQLQRASLTRWIKVLAHHLNTIIDSAEISKTKCQFFEDEDLCYLQGWVPEDKLSEVQQFAGEQRLVCLTEPVGKESPPTFLRTHPLISGAKAAVQFFQTPGYHTWDPSLVVFVSFNLFFAMILSDAGYAAACGLIVLLYRKTLRGKSLGLYRLMQSLSASALVWGVMVGSYFGFSLPEHSWLGQLQCVDLNDFDAMIHLSVGIGVLHLVVANISAALSRANKQVAIGDLAWVLVFFSGFAWFMWDYGRIGLGIGLALVFLFSSDKPWSGVKNIVLRLLDGLKALTGFSKGFGDVLSYMRLFALGLSSTQLAITFNGIAHDVRTEMPGIGLFLAILILLFGHILNFALGIMGGVIHGLRLNLIEFLNWGVKAEGYPFKPFAKQEDSRWKS